jgi:hypothetical protein
MRKGSYAVLLIAASLSLAGFAHAAGIGVYGVPGVGKGELAAAEAAQRLSSAGVDRVFVPADAASIRFYKEKGFAVYVSVNVFGGKAAWDAFDDARPVKADGSLIGEAEGEEKLHGVCPTHEKWREQRLARIRALVSVEDPAARPDGIWLDFIRYPGWWETPEPVAPDTCFCPRCLARFAADTGVPLPEGLEAAAASAWIYKNAHLAWQKWKQAQIDGFAVEAKKILAKADPENPLLLGVFTVPWTLGDFKGAALFRLAQDAFALSAVADVVSPMVYHEICGRTASWVGYMTRYLKESADCEVWPIVQSVDVGPASFAAAVKDAGRAGADGLLVFAMKGMKEDLWPALANFTPPENLIANPSFSVTYPSDLPDQWTVAEPSAGYADRTRYAVKRASEFEIRTPIGPTGPAGNALGITAGEDRSGAASTTLFPCEPGTEYLFSGRFYFDTWQRRIYPSVSLWGAPFELDALLQAKTFQPARVYYRCTGEETDGRFSFENPHRGRTFWLASPALTVHRPFRPAGARPELTPDFFPGGFFPIGVYGATAGRIDVLRMLGINTVLLGGTPAAIAEAAEKCARIGMRMVISVPRDPARLGVFLERLRPAVSGGDVAFYVNDEPGIWAFPRGRAEDLYRLVRQAYPDSAAAMAVVRPRVCRDFADAADFFLLDPYPVARRSLAKIADVLDRAGADMGTGRLAAVVQAFGGKEEKWRAAGWVRPPTWREMDCLAFLSVVHGSRGIFFYTYSEIGQTDAGRQKLARVVGRLNRIYPWLMERNRVTPIGIAMLSEDRFDPKGRPAVHACIKATEDALVLIAVNAVEAPVAAQIRPERLVEGIAADGRPLVFTEVFSGGKDTMTADGLYAEFGPYETKAWELRRR